jgi:hypothetical protein
LEEGRGEGNFIVPVLGTAYAQWEGVQSAGMSATAETTEKEQSSLGISSHNVLPPQQTTEAAETTATNSNSVPNAASGSAIMDFAVLGLLLAGVICMIKATQMENPMDVLLCLLGSGVGCGLTCFVYFRRD